MTMVTKLAPASTSRRASRARCPAEERRTNGASEAASSTWRALIISVVMTIVAGVTTTLGGLRIDAHAQVAPGVFAAGHDAGGVATGGYASGLAAALVLGRVAAESALS